MEQTPEAALYDARKWSMRRIKRARPVADKNAIYKEFEELRSTLNTLKR